MTIAQAFNEIAVAQGGTASKSGSITDAIDALNDALAGSDQAPAQTIEQAVRLLGKNIGGGGGGAGFPVVEMDETGKLNVTAGELVEMLEATPVFVNAMITVDGHTIQTWVMFIRYMTQDSAYGFLGMTVGDMATGAILVIFSAETINDYPQYEED